MIDTKKVPTKPGMASTVILVREHGGELQVYLLKRSTRSGFFPGTYVFPGGRVETEDQTFELWRTHIDLGSEDIFQRFGGSLTKEEALTYGVTAIRETFEEAGALLAYRNEYTQEYLKRLQDRRGTEELPKGWLNDLVVSEGWMLAFSRLFRWAHWITPEGMPKRYETRFFLAFMHPGQECNPDARETTHGVWVSPEKGLEMNCLPVGEPFSRLWYNEGIWRPVGN